MGDSKTVAETSWGDYCGQNDALAAGKWNT